MDQGAHFYKCDFQVHTPRDLNWDGAGANTEAERQQFAQELIAACRAKGIHAIAVTDHHDVVFFRYIRDAALKETDASGQPLPDAELLTVFPGMELTLGIPCQALLIFDADLAPELLPLAATALGITPADSAAAKHAPIQKLDVMSFVDLYEALDKLEPLRGHYIVFPHVADGGHKTLLRQGFEKHYTSMPCVGGYLDGAVPVLPRSSGMLKITSGQDKSWGNKSVGLFQTSDTRSRDFSQLGRHATWVKWARPTAEALRQACLAQRSRITHAAPKLPSVHITRVEVSNSKFLGPIVLELNPQYNAIIGGRGTGKSTVLEYLRWALCDQPSKGQDDGELADFQKRRQALVANTLIPWGAAVDVSFSVDGVGHIVRRKATGELLLKIGAGLFGACSEDNVRALLPIRAYSQKQLSAVGARLDELRRFVHAPVESDLVAIEVGLTDLRGKLRSAFDELQRFRQLTSEQVTNQLERQSLTERLGELRSTLKGLDSSDQETIRRQAVYDAELRIVNALEREASSAKSALESALTRLSETPAAQDLTIATENQALLTKARDYLSAWARDAAKPISVAIDSFKQPLEGKALDGFYSGIADWRERQAAHRSQYDQARSRAAAHEETLGQIARLEARLGEVNSMTDANVEALRALGSPDAKFANLREEWTRFFDRRAELLERQCSALSATPNTRLKATLRRAADVAPIAEHLKQLLKGTKARTEKVDVMLASVAASATPMADWNVVLDELLQLAWLKIEEEQTTTLPSTPRLDGAGFSAKEKLALARQLEPNAWLGLLLSDLKDLPVFEYKLREGDYIPFQDSSPGQQATALLSILLTQDGPPLLIDQPEDDLNMKVISDVVSTLWNSKGHRQLIFASHNANLVVNGDAELIVCCDYRTSSTESGGQIKLAGAIDVPAIKQEITDVMEGGRDAFKLRQQKYGF